MVRSAIERASGTGGNTGAIHGRTARPTMGDVALAARVDRSTVSRALNPAARHRVSADTADRILAAAESLGYRMNTIARGLRLNVTMAVGMVIPDISNPFFPPIVRGVEDTLARSGRSLILMNTDEDLDREAAAIEQLIDRQVDALILASAHLGSRAIEKVSDRPCVLINRVSESRTIPSVVPDDRLGVRLAVRHLARLGHNRIVHIAGPQDTSTGLIRRREFEKACEFLGVAGEVHEAEAFSRDAGFTAATAVLASGAPTALLAANDLIAVGCLRAAAATGLRVPADLSIVGYDDMSMAALVHPPLTTVRVPQYQMGEEAAKLVIALTRTGAAARPARTRIHVRPELIVRESTAQPPDNHLAGRSRPANAREISDATWGHIEPLLPVEAGGRWRDNREIVEAVAWRLRTGKPWRDLPERFGPWQTAWKRFDRWSRDGTWARLKVAAGSDPQIAAELDWLAAIPLN